LSISNIIYNNDEITRFPSVIIRQADDNWDINISGKTTSMTVEIMFRLGRL